MGNDRERGKTYSAAENDARFNKDEDIVVCLPGRESNMTCDRTDRANDETWKWRVPIEPHWDEQCR